jgi:catechol 2,3-dioxygenase-like lactoylglutathione lyase family enzyme
VDGIDDGLDDSFTAIVNVFALCVFLFVLGVLAVGLWSRRNNRRWWGLDVLLSAVAIIGAEVSILIAYLKLTGDFGGSGWHISFIAAVISIGCVTGIVKRPTRSQIWTSPEATTVESMHIESVAIIVNDYDEAIDFFVNALGFDLVEDSASLTNDGRPKRWVVVRPPGASTGVLLAQADGAAQSAAVGSQVAGRVGFFLRVDDFDAAYDRMVAHGVEFVGAPRVEPYGNVVVFNDIAGNPWDLLGPASAVG